METRLFAYILVFICILLLVIQPVAAYTPYTGPCPIGTNGAPALIDTGLSSGAKCRGACGMDCPDERCDLLTDSSGAAIPLTITIQEPRGICTYNNVLECPTHQGCQIHDACFDKCTEHYHMNSNFDTCHMNCNIDCVRTYGLTNCVLWADAPTAVYNSQFTAAMGYLIDQTSGIDYSGYLFFSDPPVFSPNPETPTPTPTIGNVESTITAIETSSLQQDCIKMGGQWDSSTSQCILPTTTTPAPKTPDVACSNNGGQWDSATGQCVKSEQDCSNNGGQWDSATGQCLFQTTTPTMTPTETGVTETTEPPLSTQRQTCAKEGGQWDYSTEGCIIPATSETPTTSESPSIEIPDLFKDKPTVDYDAQDFQNAGEDAANDGKYDLAIQYYNAAEAVYLKANPNKDTRPADVDSDLASLESAKASVYRSWPGHETDENTATTNAKDLEATAQSKEESSSGLPGFEAATCVLALGLLFIVWRRKK